MTYKTVRLERDCFFTLRKERKAWKDYYSHQNQ